MERLVTPDVLQDRIRKALALEGAHSWESVKDRLRSGRAQMFWNDHGAWITEVVEAPLKRSLNCWVVAGELPGVMDLQADVLAHAREQGCADLTATARFGWKHVASEYGWKEKAMLIHREVPHAA